MRKYQRLAAILICLGWGPTLWAQPATKPAERFESLGAGIAIMPPAGMKITRSGPAGNEIARGIDENRKWVLILSRVELDADKPVPLAEWKDDKGQAQPGMLQVAIDQFKAVTPGAQILKDDADTTGKVQIGYIAAKYNLGMETSLAQEAVIRASDQRYFLLTLTVPAPRSGELENDAGVLEAVDAFKRMSDSVELLDQSVIRQDQEDRLFRTRALYVNLTEQKLRAALKHEQWFRFVQDGKDVGYSYELQEVKRDLPREGKAEAQTGPEGVLVGVRSRLMPAPGVQTDAVTWEFVTFDRRYEAFSTTVYGQDPKKGRTVSGEVGASRRREKPVPVGPEGRGAIGPKPEIVPIEEYRLDVTRVGANVGGEPVVRQLPPFYLPLALQQMLPFLLTPSSEPKSYLFASWVTEAGQVMYRYVDVEKETEVTLGGRQVRATPIKDRVGLEGSVTTHFVSPDGKYLGSINEDSKTTVVASDAASIEKIWKDVDLSRPSAVPAK